MNSKKTVIFRRVFPLMIIIIMIYSLGVLEWIDFTHYEDTITQDFYFTQLAREVLSNDTKSTLIDLNNFEFIIERNTCHELKPTFLIMIVSSPDHFSRRKLLRRTWAKKRKDVATIFLLGNSEKHNEAIRKENEEFEDILQGNFEDSYRNLTYKTVMALKWITYYCPDQVKYVLKVDDDMYVNIDAVEDLLENSSSAPATQRLLFCYILNNGKVHRNYLHKWYVTKEEYPDDIYPKYCKGFAVIYTPDTMILLYRESRKSSFFWLEDVYHTGILAKQINLSHTSLLPYMLSIEQMDRILDGENINNNQFLIGIKEMGDNQMESFHNYVEEKKKIL